METTDNTLREMQEQMKVLREKLSDQEQDKAYLDKLLDEAEKIPYRP